MDLQPGACPPGGATKGYADSSVKEKRVNTTDYIYYV